MYKNKIYGSDLTGRKNVMERIYSFSQHKVKKYDLNSQKINIHYPDKHAALEITKD
jgi:hypothetical protein